MNKHELTSESDFWMSLKKELKLRDLRLHLVLESVGMLISTTPNLEMSIPHGLPYERDVIDRARESLEQIAGDLLGRKVRLDLKFRAEPVRCHPASPE